MHEMPHTSIPMCLAAVASTVVLTVGVFDAMVKQIDAVLAGLMDEFAGNDPTSPRPRKRIRPKLWPDPAFVDFGIHGNASELAAWHVLEDDQVTDWRG